MNMDISQNNHSYSATRHKLVIAEKPLVAKSIADVLGAKTRRDGAYGQIECRCYFRPACWFVICLLLHQFMAGKAEPDARISVNGVINAAMAGNKATKHLFVCGIDDGVGF